MVAISSLLSWMKSEHHGIRDNNGGHTGLIETSRGGPGSYPGWMVRCDQVIIPGHRVINGQGGAVTRAARPLSSILFRWLLTRRVNCQHTPTHADESKFSYFQNKFSSTLWSLVNARKITISGRCDNSVIMVVCYSQDSSEPETLAANTIYLPFQQRLDWDLRHY